jgi:hypothetical protein
VVVVAALAGRVVSCWGTHGAGKVTEYNNKRKSVHSSCNRINSEAGGTMDRHGGLDGGGLELVGWYSVGIVWLIL